VAAFQLVGLRRSAEGQLVSAVKARLLITGFGANTGGELLGLFVNERVIEEIERLERRSAGRAEGGAGAGIRAVEDREIGMALDALGHQVNAATFGIVNRFEGIVLGVVPFFLRREWMRAGGGAIDVVGNLESAEVQTDTGTIHADVPLEALQFKFLWQASKPRYLSDVELPEIKEKRGGVFSISGKLGEKKPKKEERVRLDFLTQRGVVLLNVDPSMVPSDLRERPLTEASRAIVRSGDRELVDAIRKVSPKLFGDYAKTLPPVEKEPTLVRRAAPGPVVSVVAPQLMRVNASVTDRNGRAVGGMKENDFSVQENGIERQVKSVTPANEPFNLVLLLDVSGSVEERIDFIRKAARDFLNTASPQDRISIISFRDDIQVISDFTTNRRLLSKKLDEIDAGGATALYDALAYVLSEPLKKLHGERTAIVVLSDGDDNKSFVPFPALLEAFSESGALVYPLYVPSGLIPESSVPKSETTRDPLRSRYLTLTTRAEEEGRKLAAVSGGVYYPVRRIEDLQRAYDDVVLQLRTAYTITYASNSTPSGNRRVRVRANREGASVRLSPAVNVSNP